MQSWLDNISVSDVHYEVTPFIDAMPHPFWPMPMPSTFLAHAHASTVLHPFQDVQKCQNCWPQRYTTVRPIGASKPETWQWR